jgi:hypothetical protein
MKEVTNTTISMRGLPKPLSQIFKNARNFYRHLTLSERAFHSLFCPSRKINIHIIIIIIIIIGATTQEVSWPPSEVSSILRNAWLLPTNSSFPASFHPFAHTSSLHIARFSHFSWPCRLHIHQSPKNRIFFHSCDMTSPS